MFETKVKNWLDKNGFNNLDVIDNDEFLYDYENHIIYMGVVSTSEGIWFQQFAYEYGIKSLEIIPDVLAFLHEIGHSLTIDAFDDQSLTQDSMVKNILAMDDNYSYRHMCIYWELPTEFAANIWMINFVNNHIEAVQELCDMWEVDE